MDDIFAEMSAGLDAPREPSPLLGIFAAEFIATMDPDVLEMATRGVLRAITSSFHPDNIIGNAEDKEIADQARRNPERDEPDSVTKLRERALAGAAVVDSYKKLAEQVTANPLYAKVQALRDLRQKTGHLPSSRRKQPLEVPTAVSKTGSPPEKTEVLKSVSLEHQRRILDQLSDGEALVNVGNCHILCRVGSDQAVLLELESVNDTAEDSKDSAGVWAKDLTLLQPSKSVIDHWREAGINIYENELDAGNLRPSDFDIVSNGGIRLRFKVPSGERNASTGRQTIVDLIRRLNPIDRDIQSPINYQLAVLTADGHYEFQPTTHAFAVYHGTKPYVGDAQLNDWLLGAYGLLPDCFYVVNEGPEISDNLVLYAFSGNPDGEALITPNVFGINNNIAMEDFRVRLLGFVTDVAPHQPAAQESGDAMLGAAQATSLARQNLALLEDGSDLSFLSGSSSVFRPIKSFHRTDSNDRRDHRKEGLVLQAAMWETEYSDPSSPGAGDYWKVESAKVFALRYPVALGVKTESYNPNREFKMLRQQGEQQVFVDSLSQRVGERLTSVIRQSLKELLDTNPPQYHNPTL